MPTTDAFRPRKLRTLKIRKRHGIRKPLEIQSAGFETLLRNHDIRDAEGSSRHQRRCQAEADELVQVSIDGGINFLIRQIITRG